MSRLKPVVAAVREFEEFGKRNPSLPLLMIVASCASGGAAMWVLDSFLEPILGAKVVGDWGFLLIIATWPAVTIAALFPMFMRDRNRRDASTHSHSNTASAVTSTNLRVE